MPHGAPFGSPDASTDGGGDFVALVESPAYQLLATGEGDPAVRIVVGPMGAGKTAYLRRLREDLVARGDTVVMPIDFDLPSVPNLRRASETFGADGVWYWKRVWRRAIARAVVGVLAHSPDLREAADGARLAELREVGGELLGLGDVARGVYAHVDEIIAGHSGREDLRRYLTVDTWASVDGLLEAILGVLPTRIAFFLDAIEEDCATEPLYWIKCQRGLFEEVLSMSQQRVIAEKVNVTASIRDATFATIRTAQRTTSVTHHPRIRVLEWTVDLAHAFLLEKLRQLDSAYLMRPNGTTPGIGKWLGRTCIRNATRNIEEPLHDYLLRHTRLLPRDVVNLGNMLSEACRRAKRRNEDAVTEEAIREVVRRASRWAGEEQLQACANLDFRCVHSTLLFAGFRLSGYAGGKL